MAGQPVSASDEKQRGAHRHAAGARSGPPAAHGTRAASSGRIPAVVPAVGLPVLGMVLGELTGSRVGLIFAVCAVPGAASAALVTSGSSLWWVVSTAPVVILAVAFGVDCLAHSRDYRGTLLATHGLELLGRLFPVMGAAVAVALLVIVVRNGRDRRG